MVCMLGLLCSCGTKNTPTQLTTSNICSEIASKDNWYTTIDNPRWKDAFIASMMGQKNISGYITGGTVKPETLYDWNGNSYTQFTNENGEIVRVIDNYNSCPIGQNEYQRRKVMFKEYEKTPGYIIQRSKLAP
jgi:hypothetical protein